SSVFIVASYMLYVYCLVIFFSYDAAPSEISTLSLHDALPISEQAQAPGAGVVVREVPVEARFATVEACVGLVPHVERTAVVHAGRGQVDEVVVAHVEGRQLQCERTPVPVQSQLDAARGLAVEAGIPDLHRAGRHVVAGRV